MTPARHSLLPAAPALALLLAVSGCERGPKPIRYGQDECAECRMTLVDQHYGAEFITAKGKVFTFDDINCLLTFRRNAARPPDAGAQSVVINFNRSNAFIPVEQAFFLNHPGLRTPMGSSLAAFTSAAELETVRSQLGGEPGRILRWPEVLAAP